MSVPETTSARRWRRVTLPFGASGARLVGAGPTMPWLDRFETGIGTGSLSSAPRLPDRFAVPDVPWGLVDVDVEIDQGSAEPTGEPGPRPQRRSTGNGQPGAAHPPPPAGPLSDPRLTPAPDPSSGTRPAPRSASTSPGRPGRPTIDSRSRSGRSTGGSFDATPPSPSAAVPGDLSANEPPDRRQGRGRSGVIPTGDGWPPGSSSAGCQSPDAGNPSGRRPSTDRWPMRSAGGSAHDTTALGPTATGSNAAGRLEDDPLTGSPSADGAVPSAPSARSADVDVPAGPLGELVQRWQGSGRAGAPTHATTDPSPGSRPMSVLSEPGPPGQTSATASAPMAGPPATAAELDAPASNGMIGPDVLDLFECLLEETVRRDAERNGLDWGLV